MIIYFLQKAIFYTLVLIRPWSFHENSRKIQRKDTLRKIIETEINPYTPEWEEAKIYPAHKIMKILGNAGLLGVSHPVEAGGLGLDYRNWFW